MVGADLRYLKLIQDFPLNYVLPIGSSTFTKHPFGDGGGFSFHAITGTPAETVFDATLALDGDGSPGSTPNVQELAKGLGVNAYASTLSPGQVYVVTGTKAQIR